MKLKKCLLVTTMLTVMSFAITGCSVLMDLSPAERAQNVVDAYTTGDTEKFESYIEKDNRLHYMLDALDEENPEGMKEVYQKVYELTKNAEITVTDKEDDASDTYAVVKIKTVDFTSALDAALIDAVNEGGESFADVPTWMLAALETGGEEVEKEIEIRTKSNNSLYEGFNEEFYDAITGGFYSYIATTMTTCKGDSEYNENTYLLSSYDKVKYSLDEFVMPLDWDTYTEEEADALVDEYFADYKDQDGIAVGSYMVDEGVRLCILINYDVASFYTLERLGIATSGDTDTISLSATISGFESDGFTCKKTDFGSGVLSE